MTEPGCTCVEYSVADGDVLNTKGCPLHDSPKIDPVNPSHYKMHKSGIECIEVTRWMPFTTGNAVKYIWRADLKNGLEDMKKARWYLNDHITHNQDAWIPGPTRDKLKEVAAADDSAPRARLLVLIAEGNLVDALTWLDSLIEAAEQ